MTFSRAGIVFGFAIAACSTACDSDEGAKPVNNTVTLENTERTTSASSTVLVSGTIALSQNGNDTFTSQIGTEATTLTEGQPVRLTSDMGETIAEGSIGPNGSFTLQIDTGTALALQTATETAAHPLIANLESIVAKDQAGKVQGLRKSLLIDPTQLSTTADGTSAMETGAHTTKRIGAIRGKVTLDGGSNPAGTVVYIPGTSHSARTDDQGSFILAFLSAGTYPLRFEKDGYSTMIYEGVAVKAADTTNVPEVKLSIGAGPEILAFELNGGASFTKAPSIKLDLSTKNAIKFKVSQNPEFSNTVYQPIQISQDPLQIPYFLDGQDGDYTLYVRVADADGNEVGASLTFRLDTKPPTAPSFFVKEDDAFVEGYSRTPEIGLKVSSCEDIASLFITASNADAPPAAENFTIACTTETKIQHQLTGSDGNKTLYLWAMDPIGQISPSPSTYTVILDQTAPSFTVTPDSGSSSRSLEVKPTLSESGHVFYTIDGSNPTASSTRFDSSLVLIGNTNLKMVGFDLAGNSSAVVERSFIIDSDAPFLGSMVVEGGAAIVNSATVSVQVSAVEADWVKITEVLNVDHGEWLPYAETLNYTFSNAADGDKRLYAFFKDDAGNLLGQNGEFTATVRLDMTPPSAAGITLLSPETPSGAFDKELLWEHTGAEAHIRYEVEVHRTAAYTDLARTGLTDTKSWSVNPVFSSEGTYYWRVRVVDTAGNSSAWVEGGEEKQFTIKLYLENYWPTEVRSSKSTIAEYGNFGLRAFPLSGSKAWIMTPKGTPAAGGCANCSYLELYNFESDEVESTVIDPQTSSDGSFGYHLTHCDLTGDSQDELIVSAPNAYYIRDEAGRVVEVANAGAVYVFQQSTLTLIHTYKFDPQNPNMYCNLRDSSGNCVRWGWPDYLDRGGYLYFSNRSQSTGMGLACERRSGRDALWVGSPGWVDNNGAARGKVQKLSLDSDTNTLAPATPEITGNAPNSSYQSDGLGAAIVHLAIFSVPGYTGPAIAVGAPGRANGGSSRGAVLIYDPDFNLLATINEPTNTDYEQFGQRLFLLGDLNADGAASSEFAIQSRTAVRIYKGNWTDASTPEVYKSIKTTTDYEFGTDVRLIGDLTGDGIEELAVGVPNRRVAQHYNTGMVKIFDLTVLDATDTGSEEPTVFALTGPFQAYQNFGASILFGEDRDQDGLTDKIWAIAPGYQNNGRILGFEMTEFAPKSPIVVSGSATNEEYGTKVLVAGDFDKDGIDDLVITSPTKNYIEENVGKADVFSGADGKLMATIYGNSYEFLGHGGIYISDALYLSGNSNVYRIQRNQVLKSPNLQNSASIPRRTSMGTTDAPIRISELTARPGEIYNSNSTGDLLFHSHASVWTHGDTRRGYAAVFDTYFSGENSIANCSPSGSPRDTACRCVIYSADADERFGFEATFVHDMNGDGLVDIAVSAPNHDNGDGTTGKVYLFSGLSCAEQSGLTTSDAFLEITPSIAVGSTSTKFFGAKLSAVQDIDGAGPNNSILLISNNSYVEPQSNNSAELFIVTTDLKQASLVHDNVKFISRLAGASGNNIRVRLATTASPPDVYSSTCSASGTDVEITMGKTSDYSPYASHYSISEAIRGNPDCAALLTAQPSNAGNYFGSELLSYTNLTGGSLGTPEVLIHKLDFESGSQFGANITLIGDINEDGTNEIAISAPTARGLYVNNGGQITIFDGTTFLTGMSDATYPANAEMIKFFGTGRDTSSYGQDIYHRDLNGDGLADFLITAPTQSSDSLSKSGAILKYFVQSVELD